MLLAQLTLIHFRGFFAHRFLAGYLFLFSAILGAHNLHAQSNADPETDFYTAEEHFVRNNKEMARELFLSFSDKMCNKIKYPALCSETYIYLGRLYREREDYDTASDYYRKAQDIALDYLDDSHPVNGKVYTQYAYLNDALSNLSEAEKWVNKSLQFVSDHQLSGQTAGRAYITNGDIKSSLGDYRDAVESYQTGIRLIESDKNSDIAKRLLSKGYNNLGVAYRRLGLNSEAMASYENAMDIVIRTFGEQDREMALIYNSIGTIRYMRGDYGMAADYFLHSAAILVEHFGEVYDGVAIAYNNAGSSFLTLDDIDSATDYLEKAQEIKEQLYGNQNLDIAVGYNNLATLYVQNKDFKRAEENYLLSIQIREDIYGDIHPVLTAPLIQLGRMYIQTNKTDLARVYLERAVEIGENRLHSSHPDVIDGKLLIAQSYLNENLLDNADAYYSEILELLMGSDSIEIEFNEPFNVSAISYPVRLIESINGKNRVLYRLYNASEEISLLKRILSLTQLASETIDYIQTTYKSEASKLNLLDKNFEIYSGAIDVIYELYEKTGDESWIDQMVFYSEKSRSRIAMEYLQLMEARSFGEIPGNVLNREDELNTNIASYYQKLNLEKEKGEDANSDLIQTYTDSLFYARLEMREFTLSLEKDYPSYFRLKYDQRLANIDDIRSMISPDESVLIYSFGSQNLYATIIDSIHKNIVKLPAHIDLTDKINALRSSVTEADRLNYNDLSHRLYEQLFEPLKPFIRNSSLIIIADQVLQYLPFELLITHHASNEPDHKLPYLVRDFKIRYTPSATVMMTKQYQYGEKPGNFLALAPFAETSVQYTSESGANKYLQQLTPLPLSGYETREIANLFRQRDSVWNFFFPEHAEVLTGRRASKERVMNGTLDDYGYIHFATHAFIHETNPSLSGIALHNGEMDEGIVYVSDIYNLKMNANLVVLGACETGLGDLHRGEGLIGFTRAFLYAGASNLVVSMWKVNDQSTALLMINFYKYIREGYEYAAALRKAKLDLINHPEYAFPRNWAAFILNGG